MFNVIGKKHNETLVSDADREISTLGSTDNAGSSVNLISGIIVYAHGRRLFAYTHGRRVCSKGFDMEVQPLVTHNAA